MAADVGNIITSRPSHQLLGADKSTKQCMHSTYLKLIFVVAVSVGQMSKFLRQFEAIRQVLWWDKVLGGFDTRMQVADLYSHNNLTHPAIQTSNK